MRRNRFMIPAAILVIVVALGLSNWDRSKEESPAGAPGGQCTIAVYCDTILENTDLLAAEKRELVPGDGQLLPARTVDFTEGESAFDVLARVLREEGIHMEYSGSAAQQTVYIRGIGNLYELDCGEKSGWLYYVNRDYPEGGVSQQKVAEGDVLEWRYTCDYGEDITLEPLA